MGLTRRAIFSEILTESPQCTPETIGPPLDLLDSFVFESHPFALLQLQRSDSTCRAEPKNVKGAAPKNDGGTWT